jgi:hypothetical protein
MPDDDSIKNLPIPFGLSTRQLHNEAMSNQSNDEDEPIEELEPTFLPHWDITPWPDPVDGQELIEALIDRIDSHVVLTEAQATAVAFWVLQTWAHEQAAIYSPILAAVSPEKDSGKTTLLSLIDYLVCRGANVAASSPAAMYHLIDDYKPTFILDEADKTLPRNSFLRLIYNTGWTENQGIPRVRDGKTYNYKVFCPKALGMKGMNILTDDTTISRLIFIACRPKLPTEHVEKFRYRDNEKLKVLRRKSLRWANDNATNLRDLVPAQPNGFNNRIGDNWSLIFNIADQIGGKWPELMREVAVVLEKDRAESESSLSPGVRLLKAIKGIVLDMQEDFGGSCEFLESTRLSEDLLKLPDGEFIKYAGWGSDDQKIHRLCQEVAKLLREYSDGRGGIIRTQQKRNRKSEVRRGYNVEDLQDAFLRYCGGKV